MHMRSPMRPEDREASTEIFGLRYLEEEDLTLDDVVGCQGIVGMRSAAAGSFTIRLCGDGGDTDLVDEE